MRRTLTALICSSNCLVGCATIVPNFDVPKDPETGYPTVATIVDRLTCELTMLVAPGAPNSGELLTGQYEVAVQLDLTVNDTGGLAPTVSYMSGPFAFGLGAKLEQSREQYHSQKLFFSLLDLRDEIDQLARRRGGVAPVECAGFGPTNLSGDLGIRHSVAMAFSSNYLRTTAKASDQGAFGGSVNFVVTKNLSGVGPTWTLTNFTGPRGLGSVSEVNTDKLTFAFAIADPPLSAAELAARKAAESSGARLPALVSPAKSSARGRADQLLQQLQINQISNRLSTIRALQ